MDELDEKVRARIEKRVDARIEEIVAGKIEEKLGGRVESRAEALGGAGNGAGAGAGAGAWARAGAGPASMLPIGSVLPWLSRLSSPSGVFRASPDLPPPGWLLCDGQVIEQGEWAGLETPHVNSEQVGEGGE